METKKSSSQPALAATYIRRDFHGFVFDMADGTTSPLLNRDQVVSAFWFASLPLQDWSRIEAHHADFVRKGWASSVSSPAAI